VQCGRRDQAEPCAMENVRKHKRGYVARQLEADCRGGGGRKWEKEAGPPVEQREAVSHPSWLLQPPLSPTRMWHFLAKGERRDRAESLCPQMSQGNCDHGTLEQRGISQVVPQYGFSTWFLHTGSGHSVGQGASHTILVNEILILQFQMSLDFITFGSRPICNGSRGFCTTDISPTECREHSSQGGRV
jgi:hypothetical protein